MVVCNAGLTTGLDQGTLVTQLSKFGKVVDIRMLPGKSYCFVVCATESEAEQIYRGAHAKSPLGQNESPVYLTYCDCGKFFF